MAKVLNASFFRRPALQICPELLGKFLVRRLPNGQKIAGRITEVEAYNGPHDLASHAARGQTPRTEVMFRTGGVWYVYLCYGVHWMLNIVTDREGYPAAILIRGVEDASGPGRVGAHFKIDRTFNRQLASRASGLWIEDRGIVIPKRKIKRTPRIGVDFAGPIWSRKPYRFFLKVN